MRAAPLPDHPRLPEGALAYFVSRLVEGYDPLRIVVFGSYARGTATRDSDVDLLVVLPEADDKRAIAVQMRRTLADAPLPKDVIVTTEAEIAQRRDAIGSVLRPALREGITVYERR